jgi:hypothetical protein
MAAQPSEIELWSQFSENLAQRLLAKYVVEFNQKSATDLPPEAVAFSTALAAFPVPIRVLVIQSDVVAIESAHTLIRYDLSRPHSTEVELLATLESECLDRSSLRDDFGIHLDNGEELSCATHHDSDWTQITQVVPYEVLVAPEQYVDDLYQFLRYGFWDVIQSKFCERRDYKTKYGLKADPILSSSELLSYGQPLANVRTGLPPTLEDWQSMVNDIVLIPQVPESVKRTFELGKKLFVFSYFVYGFSTVSQHYAFLALEAALQARWTATLPTPTPVEFGNGTRTEFPQPQMHKDFHQYWRQDRKMRVNGESFPHSTHKLLGSLKNKGILTTWQAERIEAGIHLRNEFSHLEFAPITGASASAFTVTAELINAMFDSLSNPKLSDGSG